MSDHRFHECAVHNFFETGAVTIAMDQFREKYDEILRKWRAGEATDPLFWRKHLTVDEVLRMFSAGKEKFE